MAPVLLFAAFLLRPAVQAQPTAVPAFRPHPTVKILPGKIVPAPRDMDREIICGMVVVHKSAADDPRIVLPPRDTGAAARRIEPQTCGSATRVTPQQK